MSKLGHNRERQVKDKLIQDGWWCIRAAGSLGDADVVAIKDGRILFVEVKATKAGRFSGFGPQDRRELLEAAGVAGAEAWLAWWPSRGKLVWVPSDEWPPPASVSA